MGKSRYIKLGLLSVTCWFLLGAYQLWKIQAAPIGDFANYYYATQAYLAGAPVADTYEPYTFNIWVNERSPSPVFVNYAPVPPISILAYLPFSLFKTVGVAKFWFSLIGLGLFGWVYFWVIRSRKWEVGGRKSEVGSQNLGDTMDHRPSTDNPISQKSEVGSQNLGDTIDHGLSTENPPNPKSEVGSQNLGDTIDHRPSTDNSLQESPYATSQLTYDLGLTTYLLVLLPFLLYTPLLNNLYQGQSYLYLLAALLAGYQCWETGKRNWAAVCWAIPIALKIFPAILLLFLLLKRDWRTFLLTSILATGLSLLPLMFIPMEVMVDYFVHILPRLFAGEINDPFTILYQSARVVFDQLFVLDQHLNPSPMVDHPAWSQYLYLLFQLFILAIVIALVNDKRVSTFAGFGIVILGGLLVSGYGSSYSMLLLLFPLLALFSLGLNAWPMCIALFLLFIAGNMPIYRLQSWPLVLQFPRLYALVAFLLFLLILIRPRLNGKTLLLLFALLLVKQWVSNGNAATRASYYLTDGRHSIIHDYEATKAGILLHFFSPQGDQKEELTTDDKLHYDSKLQIRDQQVYLGEQQLTFTKSRKKKPMRLNDKAVIYLSDEGRGVGFYTLRKIKLPPVVQ